MILTTEKKRTSFSNILLNYGFSKGQVDHILNSPAGILGLSEKNLSTNLMNWYTFEINEKFFTSLTANAELLTLAPTYVNNRFKELMTLFTKKDINKLLVTCPKVFLDDFVTVQEKVQYIVSNMQVEQKSIVKTYALQFDLYHIKCRHIFLCRSGHFKRVKKKEKSKNPPLDKVFSRNVETFLKLSKLTEEEFVAFCDVYEHEEKDLQNKIRLQLDEEEEDDI
ncbi:Transcription termination factor 4 like protein [Argiope bruennichi]|uniref:Transcription termination factor 4 like protein n=2 Tax=Argiope bruennichi TaxID=94029 RepID=A0A8T0E7T5_ARGBR|nr:Transcription termination factor 4 like protein [Argiope bruennichi]